MVAPAGSPRSTCCLGILSAEGGTVVRALATIDVDCHNLAAKVRCTLEQAA